MFKSLETIGNKARNVGQGISSGISSAVAEIQKDLRIENRKSGGGSYAADFDEAEVYKQMLVSFQVEQAKLGKTIEADLREKQDEASHWKRLYLQANGGEEVDSGEATGAEPEEAGGALGVDERVRLQGEVEVLKKVMIDWEHRLQDALERSTEETGVRLRLEHENAALNAKVAQLDTARKASEDLILALSAEKTRMLGSSGEASETIDDLVDEYSRLASEHTMQRQMDAETIQRLENVRDELVEKLKAHERNILQLLQRGEAEESMSREMGERSVVPEETPSRSQAAGETEEGSRFSSGEAGRTWTNEEVQKKLEEQAVEFRTEKESALAELRKLLAAEKAEAIREESESALSLAAEGHAAAMKKAAEAAGGVAALAARQAKDALNAAKEVAQRERDEALEELSKAKDGERDAVLDKAKKEWVKESESALSELEKRLKKEAETQVAAARKTLGEELALAKTAREETNALYAKENRSRKAIHNKLLELQGNIRVLARVRPMVEVEKESGKNIDVTSFPADEDIVVKKAKDNTKGKEMTETRFEFDRVFRPDSTQQGVFEAVLPLVTSVLDGYNVCIFAYGQTGSGKTFTMEGPDSNPGVNTRALTNLFRIAQGRSSDVKYSFHISMMEIYNEAVYDLLSVSKDGSKKGLDIRQTPSGGTNVPGVEEVQVSAMQEVQSQLERGGRNRAVGAHDMNEHSSRSHMILNVRVEGTNVHTGAVVRAKLNLIDLAGSERISKTDATGERLREAQNINRSLSALGDVISSLSQGKGHVPFRNSKLTFLLQDALSGNSKVLMFVNVSPASYNVTETLCSLNFAARCRNVKLGAASKNQESAEVTKYRRASEILHAQVVAAGLTPSVSLGNMSPSASPSKSSIGSKSGGSLSSSGGRSGTR